jgi:transcriptional regulator with XRE-family HTH domain
MEARPLLELLELATERDRLAKEAARLQREAGLKLREARTAADLSQSELAAFAGVPQPYVSKVENGGPISTDQLRHFHSVIEKAASDTTTDTGGAENGKQGRKRKATAKP